MLVNLFIISFILISGYLFTHSIDPNFANRYSHLYIDHPIRRKRFIFLISIILILQSGLRHVAVGADTYAYYYNFNNVIQLTWVDISYSFYNYLNFGIGKDPGYLVIQKLFQYLSLNYQLYLLFIACIFFTALGIFIYRNTNKLSEIIFSYFVYSALFYYFFSITGHRQTIATAIVLISYEFAKRRKLIPFIILILLASTIHKSALIALLFYFAVIIKDHKIILGILLFLFPFLLLFSEKISYLMKIIGGYTNYGINEKAGTFNFSLIMILIGVVVFWRYKFLIISNARNLYLVSCFTLALFFLPLTWVNPSAMRVVQYFSLFLMFLVPKTLDTFHFKTKRNDNSLIIITIILLISLSINSGWHIPYGFFWEDMKLGSNYFGFEFYE